MAFGKFRQPGQNGGQSQWLTLATLIVRSSNDKFLPAWRDEILRACPRYKKRDLHFKDLNPTYKLTACNMLAQHPIRIAAVMSNKTTIPKHPRKDLFLEKNMLYNFLCRYLVERIADFAKRKASKFNDGNGTVKIIFSRRGGMSYENFQDYLRKLRKTQAAGGSGEPIDWDIIDIDAVEAMDHKNRAGLQLADVAASALSAAVEPSFHGLFDRRYAEALDSRILITAVGNRFNYGIKPVPALTNMQLAPEQLQFFNMIKIKRGRPPAPVPSSILTTAAY